MSPLSFILYQSLQTVRDVVINQHVKKVKCTWTSCAYSTSALCTHYYCTYNKVSLLQTPLGQLKLLQLMRCPYIVHRSRGSTAYATWHAIIVYYIDTITPLRGFPKLTKFSSHFSKVLATTADIKSRLYNGKNWLFSPGTSSQSEGYSSKRLIWLVCREPLLNKGIPEMGISPLIRTLCMGPAPRKRSVQSHPWKGDTSGHCKISLGCLK